MTAITIQEQRKTVVNFLIVVMQLVQNGISESIGVGSNEFEQFEDSDFSLLMNNNFFDIVKQMEGEIMNKSSDSNK
jgi:hypothetical protein